MFLLHPTIFGNSFRLFFTFYAIIIEFDFILQILTHKFFFIKTKITEITKFTRTALLQRLQIPSINFVATHMKFAELFVDTNNKTLSAIKIFSSETYKCNLSRHLNYKFKAPCDATRKKIHFLGSENSCFRSATDLRSRDSVC